MYSYNQYPARIIARTKLSGFGEHWGVQLPDGTVAHLTPSGEQIVSFDDFAQGLPVKEIRRAAPEQYGQIVWRAAVTAQNPGQYRLLDRNCETYATWLMGEKPQSPQVQGAVVLGLIAAFLKYA